MTNDKVINKIFFVLLGKQENTFYKERHGIEIMNKFMRAVGFSRYRRNRKWNQIFQEVCKEPDAYMEYTNKEKDTVFELTKMVGDGFGLTWIGTIEGKKPLCEYCYPFAKGEEYFVKEDISVEERVMGNTYSAAFEDFRVGVFIIFFVQNGIEYLGVQKEADSERGRINVALSGLSLDGTILLPLAFSEEEQLRRAKEQKKRIRLLTAARKGDEKAMESLAYQDMDIYTRVSKRILTEDVFSIVETSFIPYGMECDQYSIVADILSAEKAANIFTDEEIWKLKLNYNGIHIDVCINQQDLIGEPKAGRRFKGNIWLQGRLA